MTPSRRVRIALLAVALAAFPAALLVPGMETGILLLSPAIVLLALLLTGHYVGEERLHRLAVAVRRRAPRRTRAARRPLPRPRAAMPRGGRLVATSLAVRPPPRPITVR
jgi:fatty acid desaturase